MEQARLNLENINVHNMQQARILGKKSHTCISQHVESILAVELKPLMRPAVHYIGSDIRTHTVWVSILDLRARDVRSSAENLFTN